MRWTSVFAYLSAAVLVVAVIAELADWSAALVQGLLLAWTVLLLPLARALFRYPMRAPAWGLFLGFWGALAVITLIVLQALAFADVMQEPSRTLAESWPLAVFGLWVLVTSLLGLGAGLDEGVPQPICWLGALTGVALLVASVLTWAGVTQAHRPAAFVAAAAYVVWTVGFAGVLWDWRPGSSALRGGLAATT